MSGTKEHKKYFVKTQTLQIRRTFPPGEKLAFCKASKIANFQSEFDNTCRNHNKHIFVRNNLLIPPLQNAPAGC